MKTTSVSLNISGVGNSSLLREFPYWQPTLTITLCLHITIPCGTILFFYLPLLVALLRLKKKHLNPLDLIHVSLLTALILDNILRACLLTFYLPSIFRHCICSDLVGTIFFAVSISFLVYQPLSFACLSGLQFAVILGKKKLVNLKVACGMIALCIGISLITVASTVEKVYKSEGKVICYDSYCPGSRPETGGASDLTKIVVPIPFIAYVPSLIIVIVTASWSCAIFKKYYTGGDDQLNRRMLSLPFIMPLTILASTVLEAAVAFLIESLLSMLSLSDLFPYWILIANSMVLVFVRFFTGLVYPLILLYTHTLLHQGFKRLLNRLKSNNRIVPITSLSTTDTQ